MTIIRDTLRDIPDGDPIVGASVSLYTDNAVLLGSTTTDSNGTFEFDVEVNPGPVYYEVTVGGVTKRHTSTTIMPTGELDLSAVVPFNTIWVNGVNPSYRDALAVAVSSGMNVQVKTGSAIIDGMPFVLDTPQVVTVSAAHATLGRIDLIYLAGYDESATDPGKFEIGYLAGTASSSPAAPSPSITNGSYIELARITVDAAVTTIVSGKISDERGMTYPDGSGFLVEDDNVVKGQAPGADIKSPLYVTYYNEDTPVDIGIYRGLVTPVSDASTDSGLANISAGTVTLSTATLPALASGQSFKIIATAFCTGQGIAALTTGTLNIKVGAATAVSTPTITYEHGVDATNNHLHKTTVTGAGATVPVVLSWTRLTGTLDPVFHGIHVTAEPVFTAGS